MQQKKKGRAEGTKCHAKTMMSRKANKTVKEKPQQAFFFPSFSGPPQTTPHTQEKGQAWIALGEVGCCNNMRHVHLCCLVLFFLDASPQVQALIVPSKSPRRELSSSSNFAAFTPPSLAYSLGCLSSHVGTKCATKRQHAFKTRFTSFATQNGNFPAFSLQNSLTHLWKRGRRKIFSVDMLAKASAADGVRGAEQERVWRAVGGEERRNEDGADAINIVSYNVLGPKQALTDKHAYSHFKWRKWPYRRERIFEELRGYNADVICLQEVCPQFTCFTNTKVQILTQKALLQVTPDTFLNDFVPFMKQLGLDKAIYTAKRLPAGEKSSRGPFRRLNKGKRLAADMLLLAADML